MQGKEWDKDLLAISPLLYLIFARGSIQWFRNHSRLFLFHSSLPPYFLIICIACNRYGNGCTETPFIYRSLSLVPIRTDERLSRTLTFSKFHHPGCQQRPTHATGWTRGCRIPPAASPLVGRSPLRSFPPRGWVWLCYPTGKRRPVFSLAFFLSRRRAGLARSRRRAGGSRAAAGRGAVPSGGAQRRPPPAGWAAAAGPGRAGLRRPVLAGTEAAATSPR